MRLLPGYPKEFANETPTSQHFSKFAISNPEMLDFAAELFRSKHTAFTTLLANQGLTSGDLYSNANLAKKTYKVVGNRKVMWKVKGLEDRKAYMTRAATSSVPLHTTDATLGKDQTIFTIFLNINWFSPKDVLELQDNETYLYCADDNLPNEIGSGEWAYHVKLITKEPTEYVDATLLAAGCEVGVLYNMYEEMSETAYEKYTFDEDAYTFMTIMRMKWSISGTARQLRPNAVWMSHNGVKMWTDHAHMKMLERWYRYRENQLILGQGTVADNDKVVMRNMEGLEIMGGDGVVNQGDGAFKLPYNKLTKRVLENIMSNMELYQDSDGVASVACICGQAFRNEFSKIMKEEAGSDLQNVEGAGSGKGINNNYSYYEFGGIRIIPQWYRWFDSPERPGSIGSDGLRNESHHAIFVSLGNVDIGQPNIQLLCLGDRSFIEGEVLGINRGGNIANSVDGEHHHIIAETGVAVHDINGIAELRRYSNVS
jgi:hypothetical protein